MIRKIILARSRGFCMGVKRAINIAEETAKSSSGDVTILNEIVHNEAVVEDFRKMGVGQQRSVDDIDSGTVIISAHGVSPAVIDSAEERGLSVVNATCPLVTRICKKILEVVPQGYWIIHFGDRDHDETKGILGHAPDRITVISSVDELDNYPNWSDRKLGLTVQSTMDTDDFKQFQIEAERKWPQIDTFDTICNATSERQAAIRDMAGLVDMVLVVGSNTSANSKRLANISRQLCGRAELIGSESDVLSEWFSGENESIETIGVSAGASTPEFLVDDVIARLLTLSNGDAEVVAQVGKDTADEEATQTD